MQFLSNTAVTASSQVSRVARDHTAPKEQRPNVSGVPGSRLVTFPLGRGQSVF